jgi:hypothetical protein
MEFSGGRLRLTISGSVDGIAMSGFGTCKSGIGGSEGLNIFIKTLD